MVLVRLDNVSLEYGHVPLLDHAGLEIHDAERVCLIGRNGAGKSSLLQLVAGRLEPDAGTVLRRPELRIGELRQTLPETRGRTVREQVGESLAHLAGLHEEFRQQTARADEGSSLAGLEALQTRLESHGGWDFEHRVDRVLDELGLAGDRRLDELSGGWRRRAALAAALVDDPDLLLLDEPTNHLDLDAIDWLERRLLAFRGSVLFVTHDRAMMDRLAGRIVELDRGRLTSWPGNFAEYLTRKAKALEDEARRQARFDRRLADEEIWIRQGIEARRTRNEGRVRALEAMRRERARRVQQTGQARIRIEESGASGRRVIEARDIGHGFADQLLFSDLSVTVLRGDRIGIVGNNGVGKTTLVRILLGEIEPRHGTVTIGTKLEIGYFDQLRRDLDPDRTVADNIADGREFVRIDGRERHIVSYLEDFLFSPRRARTPVAALSGGERSRVALARLFARPSNLLVLDEPTNDLDIETLEIVEARIAAYGGSLIVVSHDRAFLDNVVTSVLVFEADGVVREYDGGYSDWLRRGRALATAADEAARATAVRPAKPSAAEDRPRAGGNKLSYKLALELERLPDRIDQLEREVAALQQTIAGQGFYEQPFESIQPTLERLADKESELDKAIERWTELEGMAQR